MPDFGIMRGFNEKLFGDKLVAGQLPTQLGLIGSQEVFDTPVFEFSIKTDNSGVSTSTQFRMPLTTSTGLNFVVNWGDGVIETITNHTLAIHTYATSGTYTISVTGNILGWRFANAGDRLKMLNVFKWAGLKITVSSGFNGCANLTANATDAPLITTTDLSLYFRGCSNFNGAIGNWNVSNVTSMFAMFAASTLFNQPIGSWNVSNVTDMSFMFEATTFNQPINSWNVSNVTNMFAMFFTATGFNQPIDSWNVSNVTNFASFMQGKSAANYSAQNLTLLYNGWSSRPVKPNLSISFESIKYTAAGAAGRLILTSAPNNWTITDGGI
jgi:surface protein